ncbi:PREDICTED: uncharacterized protein LOC108611010 [Drosophila arizonae]|uniref:Uncharacterized protein LOC108611010 n=1 Tax=Drosophila arizonae TaxID=7263 RepID=A0ABM1NVE5_DROAR|nr:PREDICTED: uncharacterized protein LOC108611010 [Drosophila arizonae]
MPPTPKGTSPASRKRYCGLGNHLLRPPHKTITNDKLLSFAKHINPELRRTTLICGSCLDTLLKIYKVKLKHAVQLRKTKNRTAGTTNSISDVSTSQQQTQSSSVVSAYSSTSDSPSATSTNNGEVSSSTNTKRKRLEQPSSSSDDDDESMLSLNAVNGTRLPNIQPIPKRRQFVHLNKDVMDIYLSGTTGG